jgi:autotransporter-associated beta strand protein
MKMYLAYAALVAAFGASAYDNPLDVSVESGESSLDVSQLAGHDAIVKTGGGTLVLPSIPEFAGDIAIREGIVKVASEGAFGTADGKTIVAPGA